MTFHYLVSSFIKRVIVIMNCWGCKIFPHFSIVRFMRSTRLSNYYEFSRRFRIIFNSKDNSEETARWRAFSYKIQIQSWFFVFRFIFLCEHWGGINIKWQLWNLQKHITYSFSQFGYFSCLFSTLKRDCNRCLKLSVLIKSLDSRL